jgi:hypothetical protein
MLSFPLSVIAVVIPARVPVNHRAAARLPPDVEEVIDESVYFIEHLQDVSREIFPDDLKEQQLGVHARRNALVTHFKQAFCCYSFLVSNFFF